ncbi:MAG: glycosyltransferase involved in cell wall biosynthesis [Vicingaceae bacterium]|jgi:glycosyltransferase involved in cell wall biosynthesis
MVKLQVILLTYNHEKYIERALKSVASQITDFEVEVLLSNDNSTDKTLEIVEAFSSRAELKIRLLSNAKNEGILYSVKNLLSQVTAPYVAILDGDDSWKFSNKLQQQVDFLEQNAAFNGTFHDATIVHENNSVKDILFQEAKSYSQLYQYNQTIYLADLIQRLIIPTSSLVARSTFITEENLKLLTNNYSIAWKLTCFSINNAKFFYFNEQWSEYINHQKGFSKGNKVMFHYKHIEFLKSVLNLSEFKYHKYELYATISNELKLILDKGDEMTKARIGSLLGYIHAAGLSAFHYVLKTLKKQ